MNNINICDCLKVVVKDTVKHYARDFRLDEAKLKLAAKEVAKTGKSQTYLWFARESGTYMGLESEVIKKNTPAQITYDALQKDDGTIVWGSAELIVYTCLGDSYNVRVACFNRA